MSFCSLSLLSVWRAPLSTKSSQNLCYSLSVSSLSSISVPRSPGAHPPPLPKHLFHSLLLHRRHPSLLLPAQSNQCIHHLLDSIYSSLSRSKIHLLYNRAVESLTAITPVPGGLSRLEEEAVEDEGKDSSQKKKENGINHFIDLLSLFISFKKLGTSSGFRFAIPRFFFLPSDWIRFSRMCNLLTEGYL